MTLLPIAIAVMVIAIAMVSGRARTMPKPRAAPKPRAGPKLRVVSSAPEIQRQLPEVSPDALDRKRRSDARMRAEGVPVNTWLPVIESEADTVLPSTEAVAMRAVATLTVAARASGMPQDQVDALVREYRLDAWFSPEERAFLAKLHPDERERRTHSWRSEAANVLFWSLGLIDRLDRPEAQSDPAPLVALVEGRSRGALLGAARLRSTREVLDEADLIYRYRWALVDADTKRLPPPAGLDADVAMERHHALNWLVQHRDTEWDDITLDT